VEFVGREVGTGLLKDKVDEIEMNFIQKQMHNRRDEL
jgi:hypothetical protein